MDRIVAARMEAELSGHDLGGWQLGACIGHGKSALVFSARRGDDLAAVKVFDRELVDRHGKDVQRERVEREKALVGRSHPNLVSILDAGEDTTLGLFFVAMSLVEPVTIGSSLTLIPHDRVESIIAQVADAAKFLEGLGIVHRDIKPDNIAISSDFSTATLLDLGVMRPLGVPSITDQGDQRPFIGTLQYTPPEYLFRREIDSVEGWRAVTFYQLGGVLHDLLVRKPLFADDTEPYASLVDAVQRKAVSIHAPGASPELRMLAQDCLVKDPEVRLRLVTWDRFVPRESEIDITTQLRQRIALRRKSAQFAQSQIDTSQGALHRDALDGLRGGLERICRDVAKRNSLPPFHAEASSESASLRFTFGASRAHATKGAFAIYVDATFVDYAENVISVQCALALAFQEASFPNSPPPSGVGTIFEGVRDDDALTLRLTNAFLQGLDAAQEKAAMTYDAEVEWITTGGME